MLSSDGRPVHSAFYTGATAFHDLIYVSQILHCNVYSKIHPIIFPFLFSILGYISIQQTNWTGGAIRVH